MQIKEIMTGNVETIDSEANLVEAACKMWTLEVGILVVCEQNDMVGIITDRDITVRAVASERNPSLTRVKDVMTSDVCSCFEEDDIAEAAKMMEEKSIHRLMVVNSRNEPVGMVTLSDIAVKSRDEHLTYEILERISEPACPNR